MRSTKSGLILTVLALLLFSSCQKRPFAKMEVHGRVVSSYSGTPVQAEVQLWVGGSSPGSKGTTQYTGTRTLIDGTFNIKSEAQWNGNNYTLLIKPDSLQKYPVITKTVQAPKNKNTDVGDIAL